MSVERVELYRALGVPPGSIPASERGDAPSALFPPSSPHDLEALDRRGLDELERLLDSQPEATLAHARAALDRDLTERELRELIKSARLALAAPREALAVIEAQEALFRVTDQLPSDFTFEGIDIPLIPIDPGDRKFEPVADALGWLLNSGGAISRWLKGGPTTGDRERFPTHERHDSKFVYPLHGAGEAPLDIALFSDFGTGRYHSRYIAKQMATRRVPYAIHLGDVYYAGRSSEFEAYFEKVLDPLLGVTRLFTMNGNHEMFSHGIPYLDYIARRRRRSPRLQEQEGSYFCLRGPTLQIVAVDTDYFGDARCREPLLRDWVGSQLRHGREQGLTNVLLTGDEPYEYGKHNLTALLREDLAPFAVDQQLVDLWFWGNTHYAALFAPTADLPFIGSCIGHGGYPYDTLKRPSRDRTPAVAQWAELTPRFPEKLDVRRDRGDNGYCLLTLDPEGDIDLCYLDWMANIRCTAHLQRAGDGRLTLGDVAPR
ncbi:Hypothetical protein A7982_05133 [Minicystis rosea]|nr:Hypothetical protein A7982_05133 [Minicystis rosea]